VSVKAIIVVDGRLLVTRNQDEAGDYYLLPGGGQEHGESLRDALRRECREEIGADVEVHDVLLVRDYIGRNHDAATRHQDFHQIEIMFGCTLLGDLAPGGGTNPDEMQTGIVWLDLGALNEHRIYPSVLPELLPRLATGTPIYLGDVS
jgi:ADP-ribose pyrophosphatase YjhB (NUDIX family)